VSVGQTGDGGGGGGRGGPLRKFRRIPSASEFRAGGGLCIGGNPVQERKGNRESFPHVDCNKAACS